VQRLRALRALIACLLQVFVAAGEPSGDVLGARLMAALRAAAPCAVDFRGVGGCACDELLACPCVSLTRGHQASHA
jgi:lipid A disaccharide synthetase